MKRELTAAAAGMAALAAGAAGAILVGRSLWSRDTARLIGELERRSAAAAGHAGVFTSESLRGLPPAVQRYFEFALKPGQPRIREATIVHEGEFRTGADVSWKPFRSTQYVSADPPGFVWDASITSTPFAPVRVRDSYIGGRAAMRSSVAGLFRVTEQQGTRELASGALHRFLAESAWIPTALLPSPNLVWEEIEDTVARATLTDSGISVSLDFHFGESGQILRVEGERYRDVNGLGVPTPFVGQFGDYGEIDGLKIPLEGEVEWDLPEGRLTYWMGQVTDYEWR